MHQQNQRMNLKTNNKENLAPPGLKQQITQQMNKLLADPPQIIKKLNEVTTKQVESVIFDEDQEEIISCPITYKQALGLINYCRIAVYISKNIGKVLKNQIGPVVLRILTNLIQKLDKDGIIYTSEKQMPDQREWLKSKCTKYFQKYTTQQKLRRIPVIQFENLPQLSHILYQYIRNNLKIEQEGFEFYIIFKFVFFSYWLRKCFEKKDYSVFGIVDETNFKTEIKSPKIGSCKQHFALRSKYLEQYPKTVQISFNIFNLGLRY